MTLSIAFSSHASLDDACVGLLPSSEILTPDDFVTWEEPLLQLSEFDFNSPAVVESKGGLTSFNESIFKRPSNRSLHIWSLNHSLWEWSVTLINFISCGSSIPSLLPKATCRKCKFFFFLVNILIPWSYSFTSSHIWLSYIMLFRKYVTEKGPYGLWSTKWKHLTNKKNKSVSKTV